MALLKRGRFWHMDVGCNGRRIRKSTDTADRKLAETIHAKTLAQAVEGKWLDKPKNSKKTFQEMMEKYMAEHSVPNKASSGRDQTSLKHLLPCFGKMPLTDIKPNLISQYKVKRKKDGASPCSVNRELALMKHAFNLAIREWEWVNENPVIRVRKEKEPPPRDRWLRYEEEEILLQASPQWLRELIIFAVETGCRLSENLSLTWNDIDLQKRTAVIFGSKTGERRTVPLSKRAYWLLKAKADVRQINSLLVFRDIDRYSVTKAFKKMTKKLSLENLRFHDLRHTFATRLAQSGVDEYLIQKLLGHKTPSMTQRYAHHSVESLRRGIRIFEQSRNEEPGESYDTNTSQSPALQNPAKDAELLIH